MTIANLILFSLFFSSRVSALSPVEIVNSYRSLYDIPPVVYNKAFEADCFSWAKHLADIGYLVHSSPNGTYGENLGMSNPSAGLAFVVAQWYAEKDYYNYSIPGFYMETGHFTQLVWKSTTSIAYGSAINAINGKMFSVMRYFPPGNVLGNFGTNVLPLGHKELPSPSPSPLPNPSPSPNPSPKPSPNPSPLPSLNPSPKPSPSPSPSHSPKPNPSPSPSPSKKQYECKCVC